MDASLRAELLAIEPDKVEAGPETDALMMRVINGDFCPYSRDWRYAMEAAEAYLAPHLPDSDYFEVGFSCDGWDAKFGIGWKDDKPAEYWGIAATGPLAICRAILSVAKAEAEAESVSDAAGRVT